MKLHQSIRDYNKYLVITFLLCSDYNMCGIELHLTVYIKQGWTKMYNQQMINAWATTWTDISSSQIVADN